MNLRQELEQRIADALVQVGAPQGTPALVGTAARAEFGHYQANGVMAAAKKLKTNPRQLAEKVVEVLDLSDVAEPLEIAGPGFINIRVKADWLAEHLGEIIDNPQLGVDAPETPQKVVVDFCGPNLAKEMHVGHLRSSIIGDAIARVLEFIGHDVIRQNHVGDWGTQFGMLIAYMDRLADQGQAALEANLQDLEEFYKAAKQLFDSDEEFANTAREYVVKLQSGDPQVRTSWQRFIDESMNHCDVVCKDLGVKLTREDVRAESAYNDDLPNVIADLDSKGMLSESQGAQCVFLEGFTNKDGDPLPVIVQKSDGGYLYATTDLAALRYRSGQLKANRIIYLTDSRQALHFDQVFTVARKAGFVGEDVELEHVPFGMMLGENRKPFKTREGGTVKLMGLLDEAKDRAFELVSEKNADLPEDQRRQISAVVGIGAIKYADLCQNRTSDYVFSWSKMLSLEGNTAPYMQYAYARVQSIFRKGGLDESHATGKFILTEPAEQNLAVKLAQLPETISAVAKDCLPNLLCAYIYELAGAFMGFYEACPVLKADSEELRTSRLMLCLLTAKIIRQGLELLGIETLEQM